MSKADMDYVNRLSLTGKVSQTPDVTRNEGMMIKYMEAVDQVTALIQKKNAVIDRVEEKLMQMQTINGPEMLRGIYIEYKPVPDVVQDREIIYQRRASPRKAPGHGTINIIRFPYTSRCALSHRLFHCQKGEP